MFRPLKLLHLFFLHLPALAISAVCTRWRSLALSSPSLWTRFALEIVLSDTITTSSGLVSTLNLYLDRSNDCPLYIDLDSQRVKCKRLNRFALPSSPDKLNAGDHSDIEASMSVSHHQAFAQPLFPYHRVLGRRW
ncbi:hypothetical protein BT96DRAFT_422092 [Gymnopus androsaceus JB14]|uniref:Uncharacterized protein n=1 Tax=Gymnopus androsaceus JB14 TaxID=1447944 RepID=A0A6A4GUF7_9AGAR|nr:hypothetical protein BT96DRAFT_422092 [Gymnopus androsaceus JB14]